MMIFFFQLYLVCLLLKFLKLSSNYYISRIYIISLVSLCFVIYEKILKLKFIDFKINLMKKFSYQLTFARLVIKLNQVTNSNNNSQINS